MKSLIMKLLLVISFIFVAGCSPDDENSDINHPALNETTQNNSGGSNGSTTTTNQGNNKVSGSIRDHNTAQAISGARVTVGSSSAITDANGNYTVTGVGEGNRIVVKIEKSGYATTSEVVSLLGNGVTTTLNVNLLPVGTSETFSPSNNKVINVPNSTARVEIPANSLVRADGTQPDGNIHADVTPINPALDIDTMPGDMLTRNSSNQLVPIESYGAIIADFKDSSGNKLNLATGESATIRIPLASRNSNPPSTIPLYYFDESQAIWVQEGTATLNGNYYEGRVNHFSTWNADYLFENITVHGCVSDIEGNRKSNAKVKLNGVDYSGSTYTWTNSNGEFSISAKKNATSILVASTSTQVSNTVKIGSGTAYLTDYDVSLEECLKFGLISTEGITVRLTWGENPRDLDTHVIGPNGYDIAYYHKGELPSGQLDVDDTTSYGPEVFTALSFPEPGTYHYAVHHYAGESTISQSGARVEVTLNGQITTFVPPSGQNGERWWHVFDIIVGRDGSLVIEPINSWSNSAPIAEDGVQKLTVLPAKK